MTCDDVMQILRRGQSLLNVMMELRKCVNHPFLFDQVESSLVSEDDTAK